MYSRVQTTINNTKNGKDYTLLGIECCLCKELGHISIDCKKFALMKGNMAGKYLKEMNEEEEESVEESEREIPLRINIEDSRLKKIDNQLALVN